MDTLRIFSRIAAVIPGPNVASLLLALRQSLTAGIGLWWEHWVPVLFPGYLLAKSLSQMFRRHPALWMLWGFLTAPTIPAMVLLDRRPHPDWSSVRPILLWSNLFNPLMFPRPEEGLWLDGFLLVAAALLVPWPKSPSPPAEPGWMARRWILDAMNWMTVFGAAVVVGQTFVTAFPSPVNAWFDPWTAHWLVPHLHWTGIFWLAWGGGWVLGVPVWWRIRLQYGAQPAAQFAGLRVLQAGIATILWYVGGPLLKLF